MGLRLYLVESNMRSGECLNFYGYSQCSGRACVRAWDQLDAVSMVDRIGVLGFGLKVWGWEEEEALRDV